MSDETSAGGKTPVSAAEQARIDRDREMITTAQSRGTGAKLWAYTKLSGPGWLQSAITLGGGSLAGSLYLGVLVGYHAMWWQPLAMMLGIVMLSAIGFVTLSTGERPFDAINRHVNPVLGWGWAIATMMANLVWCMPQYSLGTAALRQNLMPDSLGAMTPWASVGILFLVTAVIIVFYDRGGKGVRIFEWLLKGMVGVVVVSFFAVVAKMSMDGQLEWGKIFGGFMPNLKTLDNPSPEFADILVKVGDYTKYWSDLIVRQQQEVMIGAAATAVGINMTFLLPYSMLKKGWDKDFRGLAIFDLSTGLFIPYLVATSCVVIAAATTFHAKFEPVDKDHLEQPILAKMVTEHLHPIKTMTEEEKQTAAKKQADSKSAEPPYFTTTPYAVGSAGDVKRLGSLKKEYIKLLDSRLAAELEKNGQEDEWKKLTVAQEKHEKDKIAGPGPLEMERAKLPAADLEIAAMIVKRDNADFAAALSKLSGEGFAQKIFGIGVLGMAVSTIIILMLINGFVLTEIFGKPGHKGLHLLGCLMASVVGALGSQFLWSGDAKAYLAVPTSNFGMMLLPIAYLTFFLMMNSKRLMGDNRPEGFRRFRWNVLMLIAVGFATACCLWAINLKRTVRGGLEERYWAFGILGGFLLIALIVQFTRKPRRD